MTATVPASKDRRAAQAWGARAQAWAETEEQQLPTYAEALRRVALEPGMAVLDVGCGSGVFLGMMSERRARAFGLDASQELIELARERIPEADLRVGDMQSLPYADDSFDLVFGFNSFFFAADMVAALAEARRVAKPGAAVVIQVWGRPERCALTAMKQAVFPLGAPPQRDAAQPPPLWEPGVLEAIASEAGLAPASAFDLSYAFEYRDDETLVRRMLAPAPVVAAIEAVGEERVRAAILRSLAAYRRADGSYRLENEWHYVMASA